MGSTSYVTDASGEVYQHLEYFAFGETFVEEHSNTDKTPYLFNGKELDEETGLYYYGARYYDARTSVWQSVDPKADKYPGISPFVYSFNNPLVYKDPDGEDPITGIVEAVTSFGLSIGMDFMTGWLIEGKSARESLASIGYWSATWEAAKSYAIASVTPPGTATARKIMKLAESKMSKITISTVEKMTTAAIDEYSQGKYDDEEGNFSFDKVDIQRLFWDATIETLVEMGLGGRADKLLDVLKKENKALYKKLHKLQQKMANGDSDKRINNYSKKVDEQKDARNASRRKHLRAKAGEAVVQDATICQRKNRRPIED